MHKTIAALSLIVLAQPALAQEREWGLDASDEDVYLLFGVPNTTDVGVSFWCKIDTGIVSLFTPLPAKQVPPKSIIVSIGAKSYDLATTPSEDENAQTLEAKLVPQDTLLSELQSAERFSLTVGNHKTVYPLIDADFANLMKLCAAKPGTPNN